MNFLPDVYVPCEVCKGKRYNRETLEVKYKGKNIWEVLDMTVEEAAEFFQAIPKIAKRLTTLADVGLGYVKLGQSSTTLSGGEAQRVKLATELSKRSTGKTIYILTSLPPVCTPTMCGGSLTCSNCWWRPGTQCWSSSTIWTSSRRRTISSTWVRRAAPPAAPSSVPVRRRKWLSAPSPTPAKYLKSVL